MVATPVATTLVALGAIIPVIAVVVTAAALAVVIRAAKRATVISRQAILDGAIEAAAVAMTRASLQTPAISPDRSLGVAIPTMPMMFRAADVGGARTASRLSHT